MTSFHQFHLNLLKLGYNNLIKQPPFNDNEIYAPEAEELLELFKQVIESYENHQAEAYELGQSLMIRIISGFPQYTHLFARDLLWIFGGDCIHFLDDAEILYFQQLDEARYDRESQNEPFDYLELRNTLVDKTPEPQKH